MRIIAGRLGGRNFDSPQSKRTHPMSDKARGGLFNALGDIDGLTVLDAFAGSGALGYEAISRGAASVLAMDIDKKAQSAIEANINELGISEQMRLIHANCASWSSKNRNQLFDIVISAPPYDDLQYETVERLIRHIKPGGIYVLDWPGKRELPRLPSLETLKIKNYGDAQLAFYRAKLD